MKLKSQITFSVDEIKVMLLNFIRTLPGSNHLTVGDIRFTLVDPPLDRDGNTSYERASFHSAEIDVEVELHD